MGIQTALLPVLEMVQDAELHGTPMQILSVDLKSAFDTILPRLIYKVMELEKFPTIYMDSMHQLTGSGTGRVFVNSIFGPTFQHWMWKQDREIPPVQVNVTWDLIRC